MDAAYKGKTLLIETIFVLAAILHAQEDERCDGRMTARTGQEAG